MILRFRGKGSLDWKKKFLVIINEFVWKDRDIENADDVLNGKKERENIIVGVFPS